MMCLGKPQRLAKFEVAGFIFYGIYNNLFLKIGIIQNEETPYYFKKTILPLDSLTQCFLFDVQLLWICDHSIWAIF